MALTSTLFTGLSGLDVNQTKLNVTGNNIANVNTVAFKSSRALFKPQFYVTDSAGSPPSSEFGGMNPSQRGLGAEVASIQKDFTPGAIEPTGKPTDMAIDGEGFFIVQGAQQLFTRDGSFSLNNSNQLVTSTGDYVQGFGVDQNGQVSPGALGKITIPLGTATQAKETQNVSMEGNLDASGAVAAGASVLDSQALATIDGSTLGTNTLLTNLCSASDASKTPLFTSGDIFSLAAKRGGQTMSSAEMSVATDAAGATKATTLQDMLDFFQNKLAIDTSVTPVSGPTPGVTLSGNQIIVTGNIGTANSLVIDNGAFHTATGGQPFSFTADPSSAATGESVHTSYVVYDSLGTALNVDITAVLESKADTGNTWRFFASSPDTTAENRCVGTGTFLFGNDGKMLSSANNYVTIDRNNTGASTPMAMKVDLSSMTSLTDTTSTLIMSSQDGQSIGTLNNFSIGADGTITGSFTNGQNQSLGQVAIAIFKNPQGLLDKGGNMYTTGADSGVPIVTNPLSLGSGALRSGSLELSNVDLSKEFINMIISSTGFSASSRVITMSDQLLTELLNSAR